MTILGKHTIKYVELNGAVHFFWVWPKIPFLGKFGPKNHICQLKLEFSTYTNSSMLNSIGVLTGNNFLGKFGPKIKIVNLS